MTEHPANTSTGAVFDIDGTLLDTNYLHVVAWSAAFDDFGFRVEMADIHRAIGMPSEALVDRLVHRDDPALVQAHSDHFARLRDRFGVRRITGARHLLRRCAELGWTVVLATSAGASDLDWMLPTIDADDVITGTTTSEDVERGKPHPDVLLAAMHGHGLSNQHTITVGDSVWDMESARRAHTPSIGLAAGGISAADLQRAGADEVYADPADLVEHLTASALGVRAPAAR